MTATARLAIPDWRELTRPGWPRQLAALGGLWAAILLIFARDAADMVMIWWRSSTYGHCLFIPFLIGWLVHQRAPGLLHLVPLAWMPGLAWLAGGASVWLLGDAAGLAVARHLALVLMMQGAVAATLGPALVRALLFPLFYAFFMVPVGSELEPVLQLLTAKIAMQLLGWAGVPAYIEGIFITTPTGYFRVAEACSGAKFLIAMTAYGVLVCNVCFRSWARRAVFLASALGLCLLANGVRAFATIWVAHRNGIDAAAGFDHVVYGWIFFALVMIAVMAAAWPFFDRKPGDQSSGVERLGNGKARAGSLPVVAAFALGILLAPPVWSHMSVWQAEAALAAPVLPDVPGWHRAEPSNAVPWAPHFTGADHVVQGHYEDGRGHGVDLAIISYARQSEGRELIGFGQGAAAPEGDWSWTRSAWAPSGARGEEITGPGRMLRHVVSFYRVGKGALTGSEGQVKLDTMTARLRGGDQRAVAILISAEDSETASADAAIRVFLQSLGDPEDLADAAVRTR